MGFSPLSNPVIKVKMTFLDMGLEIISITLTLSLWIYQVYIQNILGDYYYVNKDIIQSSQSLYLLPLCGTLIFSIALIIALFPENLPQPIKITYESPTIQKVYSYFLKMITCSKINILLYFNILNYLYSQRSIGKNDESVNSFYFIGMQIIIVFIYLISILIIYIINRSKQILPNQQNNYNIEVSSLRYDSQQQI
ncbi:transmembrane protein, putative (macronuclear) [Tetrahymena thermophila SB210]|uniref:Transmembrane protein, putative n=1 Tax=Tetrahymena thermophila (strain SB210) TaxID=312017 RepID=W7XI17_TETTS|nr:transmembrane protein, putative [Tetrahymena thermophila SB210]EWS74261.1 transmembrane protein, putative [Tetrahymena thermophila SB210]|eukprot:XP_012653234.1 transmembrane protein, putative [Tetrahymena thermophila SB210]